jgi:predicted NUDIX family phosphoesterase
MSKQQIINVVRSEILNLPKDVNTFISGRKAVSMLSLICGNDMPVERNEALEDNPAFRQIITYSLVEVCEDGRILLMQRMKKQGEQRLHDKLYIGAGGHTDEIDESIFDAAGRELEEELGIGFHRDALHLAGVIATSSPTNMVENVHIGICFHYLINDAMIPYILKSPEADLHNFQFVYPEDITKEQFDNMERWSQIFFNEYVMPTHKFSYNW